MRVFFAEVEKPTKMIFCFGSWRERRGVDTSKLRDGAGNLIRVLQFLTVDQVLMIDEALESLGSYGEVRLSVRKGRLRFLVMQKSFDALRGKLSKHELGLLTEGNEQGLDG